MGSRAGHTKFGRGAGALGQWLISAVGDGSGVCSDCGKRSSHRHGWHERHLQDLPAQGAGVTMKLRIQRWQCRNKGCNRQTCAAQLPERDSCSSGAPHRSGGRTRSSHWPWPRRPARRTVIEAHRPADQRRYARQNPERLSPMSRHESSCRSLASRRFATYPTSND